jgi:alcohol dehydrogenase (NADP+)
MPEKEEDAKKLGAKEFISTKEKDWAKPWAFTFDFILNSADMTHTFDLSEFLSTLAANGTFHSVGLPDQPLSNFKVQDMAANGSAIATSHIGSRLEMLAMLKLASEKNIKTWVETIDISAKGCKEAVEKVKVNNVRYRFTLVNYDKAFGSRE